MHKLPLLTIFILLFSSLSLADEGVIKVKSTYSVKVTADRFVSILESKGMTVFDRIHHATAARKVGINLRPTQLIIFGNPKIGSRLMKCGQTIGIDLPQKALIWKAKSGQVWLSYNNPEYLARRHHLKGCQKVIRKVKKALKHFALKAAK